ncbi:MAG: pilus assembly protein PilM [bacterium]
MHSYSVGIEIGSSQITIIQVKKKANSVEIVRFFRHQISPDEDISAIIKRILTENKIRGDLIVAGISSQKAIFRSITLPFRDRNKIHKVARFEVESSLPYPAEEAVLALQVRDGKDAISSDLFIGAVKKETVASCCQSLNAAGIDPYLVLLDCTALYDLYLHAFPSSQEVIALVDIDEERILMIVVQGEHLLFSRSISNPVRPWPESASQAKGATRQFDSSLPPQAERAITGVTPGEEGDVSQPTGEKSIGAEPDAASQSPSDRSPFGEHSRIESLPPPSKSEAPSGTLELPKAALDFILEEIDLTIYACSAQLMLPNDSISRIVLMGKVGGYEGISDYFTQRLEIETSVFNPIEAAGEENAAFRDRALSHSLAVPLGLVLGGKKDKKSRLNLRQEELAYQRKYTQFKEMAIVLVVLIIATVSLLTLNIRYRTTVQQEKLNQINHDINQIYQEIFPGAKHVDDELLEAKKALNAEKERYKIYKIFAHKFLTHLDILKDLSIQAPEEIQVEFVDLSIDKNQVKIKGIADSFESIDRLKNRLQKTKQYAQTVVESAKVKGAENKVDFRLNITISDS